MGDHVFDEQILRRLVDQRIEPGGVVVGADLRVGADGIAVDSDATKLLVDGDRVREIGKDLERYNAYDTGAFLCTPSLFEALAVSTASGDGSLSGGVRRPSRRGPGVRHPRRPLGRCRHRSRRPPSAGPPPSVPAKGRGRRRVARAEPAGVGSGRHADPAAAMADGDRQRGRCSGSRSRCSPPRASSHRGRGVARREVGRAAEAHGGRGGAAPSGRRGWPVAWNSRCGDEQVAGASDECSADLVVEAGEAGDTLAASSGGEEQP